MKAGLDRVIIKEIKEEEETVSFSDTTVDEALVKAEIISVGFDRNGVQLPYVQEGDLVYIDGKAVAKPIPNSDLSLIRYTDVLIII